jgi:hypothetical protein
MCPCHRRVIFGRYLWFGRYGAEKWLLCLGCSPCVRRPPEMVNLPVEDGRGGVAQKTHLPSPPYLRDRLQTSDWQPLHTGRIQVAFTHTRNRLDGGHDDFLRNRARWLCQPRRVRKTGTGIDTAWSVSSARIVSWTCSQLGQSHQMGSERQMSKRETTRSLVLS